MNLQDDDLPTQRDFAITFVVTSAVLALLKPLCALVLALHTAREAWATMLRGFVELLVRTASG